MGITKLIIVKYFNRRKWINKLAVVTAMNFLNNLCETIGTAS